MYDALHRVSHELEPNEELLWSGQPKRGVVFQAADVFLIPFSILWSPPPLLARPPERQRLSA